MIFADSYQKEDFKEYSFPHIHRRGKRRGEEEKRRRGDCFLFNLDS